MHLQLSDAGREAASLTPQMGGKCELTTKSGNPEVDSREH